MKKRLFGVALASLAALSFSVAPISVTFAGKHKSKCSSSKMCKKKSCKKSCKKKSASLKKKESMQSKSDASVQE